MLSTPLLSLGTPVSEASSSAAVMLGPLLDVVPMGTTVGWRGFSPLRRMAMLVVNLVWLALAFRSGMWWKLRLKPNWGFISSRLCRKVYECRLL